MIIGILRKFQGENELFFLAGHFEQWTCVKKSCEFNVMKRSHEVAAPLKRKFLHTKHQPLNVCVFAHARFRSQLQVVQSQSTNDTPLCPAGGRIVNNGFAVSARSPQSVGGPIPVQILWFHPPITTWRPSKHLPTVADVSHMDFSKHLHLVLRLK